MAARLYHTPGVRTIAVDPGHRSTRAVEILTPLVALDGFGNPLPRNPHEPLRTRVWNYSRAQRRHEAKAARTTRRYAGWNSLASVEHAALAGVTHRTANHESFDNYLAVLARHGPRLWELRSHKRWVRERFRSWRAYQRSELGFWRRVCHGLPQDGTTGMESVTTIAYGDADIGQPGRGGGGSSRSMRGPCEAVFGKRRVVGVDEFLTSQRCHVCTEQLHTVVDMRPGHWLRHATQPTLSSPSRRPRKGDVVWGLKCCTSSSCSRRFHDRDTNAALNILCAFLARHRREERPPYLTSEAEGWTKGRAGVSVVLSEPEGSVLGALPKGGHLYRPGVP